MRKSQNFAITGKRYARIFFNLFKSSKRQCGCKRVVLFGIGAGWPGQKLLFAERQKYAMELFPALPPTFQGILWPMTPFWLPPKLPGNSPQGKVFLKKIPNKYPKGDMAPRAKALCGVGCKPTGAYGSLTKKLFHKTRTPGSFMEFPKQECRGNCAGDERAHFLQGKIP